MTVLDVIDPAECDRQGVPLDWERCRRCVDRPGVIWMKDGTGDEFPCPDCDGHGSLKAAALVALEERLRRDWRGLRFREREARGETFDAERLPADKAAALDQIKAYVVAHNRWYSEAEASFVIRCEGCGHPMAEGVWEGTGVNPADPDSIPVTLEECLVYERQGFAVHYSPCDEVCRHLNGDKGGFRITTGTRIDRLSEPLWLRPDGQSIAVRADPDDLVEASWRQVDVRALGWAHDLRPEKLAVLCLRCWSARQEAARAR